ncbi:MAG: CorA family divalent cation transporter [Jaaginema sp. PMC 1079.18]|nr:CorA family divalent cation transporter [Jaaginema sp. PMC 1080.18]MEC4852931.1 CorA family divalent cation transporter [Jaaginema sp. PMC 1079.18]MEC4865539.1 CorA family divalent cation transporter [Jaaginema sp. PMC 1078.18]
MKLPEAWQLPAEIKNRFGRKSAGKQRAMLAENHLLLVLHQAPQPGEVQRHSRFFWRNPEGEWQASGRSSGFAALRKHIQDYESATETLYQRYEEAQVAADYFQLLEDLMPLYRAAQNLRTTLQQAREGVKGDRDIIDLRDTAETIERSLELLQIDAKHALDYKIAQQAEAQSQLSLQSLKTAHRLNILAAVFFPLTAISCVFGMNIPNGFESSSIWLFWLVFLGGISLGFVVRRWAVDGKLL